MSRFMLKWNIEYADVGKSVKEFLKEQKISKTALTDIKFHGGKITVNDVEFGNHLWGLDDQALALISVVRNFAANLSSTPFTYLCPSVPP